MRLVLGHLSDRRTTRVETPLTTIVADEIVWPPKWRAREIAHEATSLSDAADLLRRHGWTVVAPAQPTGPNACCEIDLPSP